MKENIKRAMNDPDLPKFDDAPIRQVLGEAMPKMSLNKVGRLRLVSSLAYKYGDNFRNFEAPNQALTHFDNEHEHLKQYLRLKGHTRG